ncbi:hypothetical protein [Leptotrichia wadei]|nr:hypothetical protein [Leptotrichia wadei]
MDLNPVNMAEGIKDMTEELTDELIIRNKGMYEVIKLEKGKIF